MKLLHITALLSALSLTGNAPEWLGLASVACAAVALGSFLVLTIETHLEQTNVVHDHD